MKSISEFESGSNIVNVAKFRSEQKNEILYKQGASKKRHLEVDN